MQSVPWSGQWESRSFLNIMDLHCITDLLQHKDIFSIKHRSALKRSTGINFEAIILWRQINQRDEKKYIDHKILKSFTFFEKSKEKLLSYFFHKKSEKISILVFIKLSFLKTAEK